jgi:hypothetical protein
MVLSPHETGNLTRATNTAASRVWGDDCIIGHVGDDHVFRTRGWDRTISDVLREPGVAYGDDGFQGSELPTAVFMSSAIPRALGWYALPSCRHMKIDRAWKRLGEGIGRLHYLPDVLIEHMHPLANKAEWDTGYREAREAHPADGAAYMAWISGSLGGDLARLRHALGIAA